MAPHGVLDEFFRYVQNEIPIRLIYVKEKRLVDRYFVQQHYLPSIEMITEEDLWGKGNPVHFVPQVVKYDILSHRWLPQGEPTVKDMMDGTAVHTPGYAKLLKFCEAAGSEFVWSDTCCIDKSSSSELDESIRSMFKWYRNATTCIVHLAQTTRLADMGNDEWFERGWTLQELLAPRVIKFYDANWRPFIRNANDKENETMLELLVSATGVPEHNLRRFNPQPRFVDQRMSWAAKRRTARAEDMAYSLMGIFDVNIQPAYGEGGERAFCRLVEAILLSSDELSVLDWAGNAAFMWNSQAMPSSPRCYLGHPSLGWPTKLDIAMTGRGLRIPLVMFPLELKGCRQMGWDYVVTFSFSDLSCAGDIDDIHVEVLDMRVELQDFNWALGLFHYLPPNSNYMGHPALQRTSAGYLLRRSKVRLDQSEYNFREGQILARGPTAYWEHGFHDWWKVSTAKSIHVTFKSIPEDGSMVVDKKRLEVVYL